MSFLNIVYTILIGPLQLLFEVLYSIAYRVIHNEGLCIVVLSLAMNLLVLPLYRRADALQAEERDTELRLKKGVDHIKKTFRGDDRMMILQTYYRQNHYKPTDALKGSFSLLLEIPFFLAAYQFLSNLTILQGVGFGPIRDLGAADGLLLLGDMRINILPVLMTVINLISSAIYTKGFPVKTKVQLYGMAVFFLVFLYRSPSGLVFYWTLNNLFSLAKTIFYKIENASFYLRISSFVAGVAILAGSFLIHGKVSLKALAVLILMSVMLQLPLCLQGFRKIKCKRAVREKDGRDSERTEASGETAEAVRPEKSAGKAAFLGAGLLLTVLSGILIPSAVIQESPLEFIDPTYFFHPLWYVGYALCLSAGVFLIWFRVFYSLADDRGKYLLERGLLVFAVLAIVNYMYFGRNLGMISSSLIYDKGLRFSLRENLLNLAVLGGISLLVILLIHIFRMRLVAVLFIGTLVIGGMGVSNAVQIHSDVKAYKATATDRNDPVITLSRSGQNIVFIMLDRGMGLYVPYIMQEKPELLEQFSGFTYYNNVISFGAYTNFGTPALFGGYEYRPEELNKRDTEVMRVKHNEALSVMPTLFSKMGYDVTMVNPTYANYQWIPDLSIFEDTDFKTYLTKGLYSSPEQKESAIAATERKFFCYSLMKILPLFVQPTVYNEGAYNALTDADEEQVYSGQVLTGMSTARGLNADTMDMYHALTALPYVTQITDSDKGCFLFYVSELTHDPMLYEEPSYQPVGKIDNTEYDEAHQDRFTIGNRTVAMENAEQMSFYHANMAAMIQIGKWLDYLKKNGVYDNTRIIIAADHGMALGQVQEMILDDTNPLYDGMAYFPLLMVKDFEAAEFTVSEEFMTNADVPALALADIVEEPVNPFTGKRIDNSAKYEQMMYILASEGWGVHFNSSSVFYPGDWIQIHDSIWERENWEIVQTESVSPYEHVDWDEEQWYFYKEVQ